MLIHQFAVNLAKINTIKQAESLLAKYLKHFGFTGYAFTYYSGHIKTGRKLRYHYVSDALRHWHNHYLEQGYADVDRTLEESNSSTLPLFWDVHTQLAQAKNKRERRIRQESIDFGIDKGLSVQVYGPNNDFVTLTLHQFRQQKCLKEYELHQYEWQAAAQLFYHYIKKILSLDQAPTGPYKLTKREKLCLMMTAKYMRVEQIAKELKVTPRTVNFHIQNANKKLGVNNKYQAIQKYFEISNQGITDKEI